MTLGQIGQLWLKKGSKVRSKMDKKLAQKFGSSKMAWKDIDLDWLIQKP